MKFAHLADVHIGSWRDPRMKSKSIQALTKIIDICIQKKVDFILIAGDLFNTALPSIDLIKETVTQFMRCKEQSIPIYLIAGSHDYSVTGKSMLEVLEQTGVFTNVMKGKVAESGKVQLTFTQDPKTGVKITGILGKANMLDKEYYESLDLTHIEKEPGKKIFLFHTAITECMPNKFAQLHGLPLSFLPKGFDYYAGGHVHFTYNQMHEPHGRIVYPGPAFPADFEEIEDLKQGSFVIVEDGTPEFISVPLHRVISKRVDVTQKSVEQIKQELLIEDVQDAIVTLRLKGKLLHSMQELKLNDSIKELYAKGAYMVMKNTAGIEVQEFEHIQIKAAQKNIEQELIEEQLSNQRLFDAKKIQDLLQTLAEQKQEGETVKDFEDRVYEQAKKVLGE